MEPSDKEKTGMTDQEILAELATILNELDDIPADKVTPDKSFVDDLDVDSLTMVEVSEAVKDKFGIEINDDQLKELVTVQDVVSYISKNTKDPA
jgi:acyl carrier protein